MKILLSRIVFCIILLSLLIGFATSSMAAVYRTITFPASDTIVKWVNVPSSPYYYELTDNGVKYTIATKHDMVGDPSGAQNVQIPTISTAQAHSAPSALHILMDPLTTGATPGEKVLINVCDGDNDSFAIGNNQTSALKFWIFLPTNYQAPTVACQMCEWWNDNAIADLDLGAGNTWNMGIYTTSTTHRTIYGSGPITTGVWHKFVVQLTTSYTGTGGAVSVWLDGTQVVNQSNIQVGLASSRKNFVEAGLYRGGQNTTTEVWMDDIMYGDTYSDVVTDPQIMPNGIYAIQNLNSLLVLDAYQSGITNGTQIDQNTFTGATNQQWNVTSLGNGLYSIVNVNSSLAMQVHGNYRLPGGVIDLWTWLGASKVDEDWIITPTANGYYTITNDSSSLLLNVPNSVTTPGTFLDQNVATGGANQQWSFNP